MANESLKRTPTSSGNRRVFTFSAWVKKNVATGSSPQSLLTGGVDGSDRGIIDFDSPGGDIRFGFNNSSSWSLTETTSLFRDPSSWKNVVISVNLVNADVSIYVNGIKQSSSSVSWPSIVNNVFNAAGYGMYIGSTYGQNSQMYNGQMFDVFWVDGQALKPDVFGFYKDGDGYVSAGSTQATDFRPGQWSPHSPRKIKTEIERKGGFGVNGFYLPMNDSSNPGADFHCAPNSIITLKGEDLPQPRNGAPTTSDAYVSQLRTHTGGLFNDGVVNFGGSGDRNALQDSGNAVNLGTGAFTVEAFVYHSDLPQNSLQYIFMNTSQSNINTFAFAVENDRIVAGIWAGSFSNSTKVEASFPVKTLKTGRWYHYAACRSGNTLRLFIDGKMMVEDTSHTENYNNTSQYGCRVGCEAGAGATVVGYKDIRGFMSNVRVVNGTALYTSDFTPPTEPLTNVTNTVLLCCQSPTSATAAAVSPGTLSLLTETGDRAAFAARNELDASIVLAVPGITGGQSSGYGDYSADIRGNGSNKTVTANGNATVASVSSYYGSALSFDGNASTNFNLGNGNNNDFDFGSDDFTIEFWRKRNSISDTEAYFTKYDTGDTQSFWFGNVANGKDGFWWYDSDGTHNLQTATNAAVVGQFDHLCAERHHGTTSLYLNGVRVAVSDYTNPSNNTLALNTTTHEVKIGANDDDGGSTYYPFDGEIQDLRVYRGLAKYKGGFDVPKPYTPVGIEAFRTVADTCKNNFATLNSVDSNGASLLSNGNLTQSDNSSPGTWNNARATIGVSSGKWYWEMRVDVINQVICASVAGPAGNDATNGARLGYLPGQTDDAGVTYYDDGRLYHAASQSSGQAGWGAAYGATDVIGIALDMNDSGGKVWFSKNGSWQASGNPSTGANAARSDLKSYSDTYFPISGTYFNNTTQTFNFGQNPTFSGTVTAGTNADDSGKGLFKYAPPSGFLALCEDNLSTPAIADPGDHFKCVLYTGSLTGGGGKLVSGVGFKPDLIWIKNRSRSGTNGDGNSDHALFDSVRGYDSWLASNTTNAENTNTPAMRLTGVHEDGFSVGYYYVTGYNGDDYVAWCWKAGGPTVPNTNGTITSQVSVNQTAGFSIVSYTGTGSNATVGHGLNNKTPKFIITKQRTTAGHHWRTYHSSIGATRSVYLDLDNAQSGTDSGFMNNTEPTTSVFSIGTDTNINESSRAHIAYCWAEIEGYSKFGSYEGNGNADGPFVYCGFKPAWVMVKCSSDSSTNWRIWDSSRGSTNPTNLDLLANTANIENSYGNDEIDLLSNGFKIRSTGSWHNLSGGSFIFMAFAESPFQTANAK